MAERTTLNVSLTRELGDFVASKVASGRYLSASEVVRDGLRLLEERERQQEVALSEVQRKIEAGLESLDRGEGIPGEQVFEDMEARLEPRGGPWR
jgi:antitoxin ParD1/3/4